eukprot:Skav229916  [mRNA]  locus=scaffold877:232177:235405:+ [translate_table: standard]
MTTTLQFLWAKVKYYNRIDEELELPLDILDTCCEAGEKCGALNKLFDLLDERTLKLPEIAEMLELLGRNWNGTAASLITGLWLAMQKSSDACNVFNGRRGCMTPVIDLKALKKALGLSPWEQLRRQLCSTLLCSKIPS